MKVSNLYNEDYLRRLKEKHPQLQILPRLFVSGMQGDVFYLAGL